MMTLGIARLSAALALVASPALAASGPFFSLRNTDFIVLIGFLVFVGILLYFRVPRALGGLLDKRAEGIRNDLAEARRLREEAQELFASYQRRQREVQDQADEIITHAKREADANAEKAKADLQASIERRLAGAEDQIASAEADAIRAVRNRAISVATAAAAQLVASKRSDSAASAAIDRAIDEVAERLH